MAGSIKEDYEMGRLSEGTPGGPSMEALAEWRSSEQVENGTPSTSPPYWDTDDDDDDCGAKPSELYGKFTWKVENFSQISKRELRSNAFEVGGYKWYILIYPQGCDVSNHLSLFLCVANHDKLLPGWSHFAQFTICVANKDPKKSKYSDTLHRFWKKEHDWGWKKFMELSKVLDGFVNEDSLVIKAQVQVIREKADRPFRCLDCFYRRELVRVYLTNVEQICRRFVEERRSKLVKLIEDKARWLSFCNFWSEIDQNTRRRMTREKTDAILRVVVKHFFVEKEVTSTLVMDSLYSGLRALECQSKSTKATAKLVGAEETKPPIVCIEKDMFVLTEDVLLLLERVSLEILPPKDEKGPQNRTKDGNSGDDINKDSIERDERRLTELGCRTIEIFVLAHIFSNKIEVAHQEAVALKKQEELIREEEAAGQAENEHKTKRGTTEKEKRAKKKQSKQRRSSRKVKDKKDEKSYISIQNKQQETTPTDFGTAIDLALNQTDTLPEKSETVDDVSNATDTGDDVSEMLQQESEDRDASIVSWDTDASEIQLVIDTSCNGVSSIPVENKQAEKKSTSVVDDSSSTCSTDSAVSVVVNGNYKEDPPSSHKSQTSPSRGKKQFYKETHDHTVWEHGADLGHKNDSKRSCAVTTSESESVLTLKDRITLLEQHLDDKQDVPPEKKLNVKDMVDAERPSKQMMAAEELCSLSTPTRNRESNMQPKPVLEGTPLAEPVSVSETFSNSLQKTVKAIPSRIVSTHIPAVSKSNVQHAAAPSNCTSCTEKPTSYRGPVMSRPSSAPIVPDPRPSVPFVSMVQTSPSLARSVSAAGRLGPDPSAATRSYVSSPYRNAIMGKTMGVNPSAFMPCPPSSINPNPICSQPSSVMVSSPMLSPQSTFNRDQGVSKPGFTFGSVTREVLNSQPPSTGESSQLFSSIHSSPSLLSGIRNLDIYGTPRGSRAYSNPEPPASMSGSHAQGRLAEDFPHLDIINSLFDEEQSIGRVANDSNNGHHHQLTRQYSFPGDVAMPADMVHGINCCRLDQPTCYYDDAVHGAYGSSYGPYDGSRNAVQGGMPAFTNGQIDRVMQNQWPSSLSHVSLHGMRNTAGDLYPYQRPEYSNAGSGVNSYTMFPPTSGN